MASKIKTNLFAALAAVFQPLVDALDMDSGKGTDKDNGQDYPSQKDVGLRIVIGGLCNVIHGQLHGNYETSTGSKIPNVFQRYHDSLDQISTPEFQERLNSGTMTNRDMNALDWFTKNEARFDALTELDNALKELHESITGEAFKPYERKEAAKPVINKAREAAMARVKALGIKPLKSTDEEMAEGNEANVGDGEQAAA